MRKIIHILLIFCVTCNQILAQTSKPELYKKYLRVYSNKDIEERIFLYKDGTFDAYYQYGYPTNYNGGWWIDGSHLVLQPAWNCSGPKLIEKIEYIDTSIEGLILEIYNEKGILIMHQYIDKMNNVKESVNSVWGTASFKKGYIYRRWNITIKWKHVVQSILTRKENNHIVLMILEPKTSCDTYFGIQRISLDKLIEVDTLCKPEEVYRTSDKKTVIRDLQ